MVAHGPIRLLGRAESLCAGVIALTVTGLAAAAFMLTGAAPDSTAVSNPKLDSRGSAGVLQRSLAPDRVSAAAPEPPSALVAVVQAFVEALSLNDVEAAMALVADGAIFQTGMQPFVTNLSFVHADLEAIASTHAEYRLLTAEVGGSTVRTRVSVSADPIRRAGFARIIWSVNWVVIDGRIAAAVLAYDAGDAETRRYVALLTAPDEVIPP